MVRAPHEDAATEAAGSALAEIVSASAPSVCERCGSFAPLAFSWSQRVCESCDARVVPAKLRAKSLHLLRASHALVRQDWLTVLMVELLISTPWGLAENIIQHQSDRLFSRMMLIDFAMSAYAEAIAVHLLIQRLTMQSKPSLADALIAARRRLPIIAVTGVLTTAISFAGLMLLAVPGFWIMTSTWLVIPLLVATPLSLWGAIRESYRRMSAYKLVLSAWLVGLLLCIPAIDWVSSMLHDQYDVLTEMIFSLSSLWLYASSALLYANHRPWQERHDALAAAIEPGVIPPSKAVSAA